MTPSVSRSTDVAAKARWALTRIGDLRAIPILAAHLGAGDDTSGNGLTRDLASFGKALCPPSSRR